MAAARVPRALLAGVAAAILVLASATTGSASETVHLGTFVVGSTISAPYQCAPGSDLAVGTFVDPDHRLDPTFYARTVLSATDTVFTFVADAPAINHYYALSVLCGVANDSTGDDSDFLSFTNSFSFSFGLVFSCDPTVTAPPPTTDPTVTATPTSPPTTDPVTTDPPTTSPVTTVPLQAGPSRATHLAAAPCPAVGSAGSGSSGLPDTGGNGQGTLTITAAVTTLVGGGLLLARRRRPAP